MNINEICVILKSELYNNGYEYGFSADGKRYLPDTSRGFDSEYYKLSCTIYTVQEPKDTMEERLGTCIDAVVLMKHMLDELNVKSRIWLLHNKDKNKAHTILTFEAEDKIVYLELTPQFSKPRISPASFALFAIGANISRTCARASGRIASSPQAGSVWSCCQ